MYFLSLCSWRPAEETEETDVALDGGRPSGELRRRLLETGDLPDLLSLLRAGKIQELALSTW